MKPCNPPRKLLLLITAIVCRVVTGQDLTHQLGPYEKMNNSLLQVSQLTYEFAYLQDTLSVEATWNVSWPSLEQPPDQWLFSCDRSWLIEVIYINDLEVPSFEVDGNLLYLPMLDKSLRQVTIKMKYKGHLPLDGMASINEDVLYHLSRYVRHENALGYDLRKSLVGQYWEQKRVQATIETDENTYGITAIGSSPNKTGRFTLVLAETASYQLTTATVEDTEFEIYNRWSSDLFQPETIIGVIQRVWPQYLSRWPTNPERIVFLENSDFFFGGQIVGTNVFQFNMSLDIPKEVQSIMPDFLGIVPCSSTMAIAEQLFPTSENAWEDYLLNLIIHELGHLFFGFGKTAERKPFLHDYWFSLGLGFLHDEEIYGSLTNIRPGLIDFATHFYQTRIDTIPSIDKRLTAPDLSGDELAGISDFHRVQYFAHARSYLVLRALKSRIGDDNFMGALSRYVESGTLDGGYEAFRSFLVPNLISDADLKLFEEGHQMH